MNRRAKKILLVVFVTGAVGLQDFAVADDDDDGGGHGKLRFEYAAQFNCGANPANPARIQVGNYSSEIQARNASSRDAKIAATISVGFPPAGLSPGAVVGPVELTLGPGEAVAIGCADLELLLGDKIAGPPYFAGVLTLLSNRRHNVFATYTVTDTNALSTSIAVDRIPNSGNGRGGRDF